MATSKRQLVAKADITGTDADIGQGTKADIALVLPGFDLGL
jgi:hypothetical protein